MNTRVPNSSCLFTSLVQAQQPKPWCEQVEQWGICACAWQDCRERSCGLEDVFPDAESCDRLMDIPSGALCSWNLNCGCAWLQCWSMSYFHRVPGLGDLRQWKAEVKKRMCDAEEGGGQMGVLLFTAFLFNPLAVFKFSNWNLILAQCISPLNTNLLDLTWP